MVNIFDSIARQHQQSGRWHAYYAIPAFVGFTVTYLLIQLGVWLSPNFHFQAGGYHIHHYTYGIIILLIFGYVGIWTQSPKMKYFSALAYGVGAALIIDEAWLWFTLTNVTNYQDYDLAFYVAALLLGIAIVPIFLNGKGHNTP